MSLADQVAALEAANVRLNAQLALYRERAGEVDTVDVDLMVKHGLTGNCAALLRILIAHKPRAVSSISLDAELPMRNVASGRQLNSIRVLVCQLRKKLGADTIETTPAGYRLNPKWSDPPSPVARPSRFAPLEFAYGGQP